MLRHTFIPDYTVKAVTEMVYIQIKRNLYLAAKRATLMERSQRLGTDNSGLEPIDAEVEKLLHSLDDEDDRSVGADTANLQTPKASKPTSNAPSPTLAMLGSADHHNGPLVVGHGSAPPATTSMRSNSLAPQRTFDDSDKPLLTRSKS